MDKFKEYLMGRRAELDVDSPASDTWERIELRLPAARSGSWRRVAWYAVAACMIALAGTGLWMIFDHKAPADTAKTGTVVTPKRESAGVVRDSGVARVSGTVEVSRAVSVSGRKHKTRFRKPAGVSKEIDAIDKSYSSLIDYQLKKLRATPLYAENGSYFSFYIEQFKEMDQDEQEVRNEIKAYGLTSEFLEQLINVYQQKLNMLKNLQKEINKMNNRVRGKEAPSTKIEVHYLNI